MTIAARVVALVVAVGLVLGAIELRDRLDGGDGDGDGGDVADGGGDGAAMVICPREVSALCGAVDGAGGVQVRREATATTVATASAGDPASPWLVPVAWADVVDDARTRGGLAPLGRSEVVATTPMVVVGWEDRVTLLAGRCGVPVAEFTVACMADVADQRWDTIGGESTWGRVKLGHAGAETATGLVATAVVAASVAGPDFGATELAAPDAAAALRRLESSVPSFTPGRGGHLGGLFTIGRSVADVVVATEAEALQLAVGTDQPSGGPLLVVASDPLFAVELVVVDVDQEVATQTAADLRAGAGPAVGEAGWRVDGPPAGSLLGELPPLAPRPDGPSLTALLTTWAELTR